MQELSLDMDTLEIDPSEPTIWFPSPSSQAPEAASSAASPFAAASTQAQRPSGAGPPPAQDTDALSSTISGMVAEGATVTAAPAGEQEGGEAVGHLPVAGGGAAARRRGAAKPAPPGSAPPGRSPCSTPRWVSGWAGGWVGRCLAENAS